MLWLVPSAFAAPPIFSAFSPDFAEKARKAWIAAEKCTGWEAPHHEQVELRQGYVSGGFVGGAWIDSDGLYRVQIGLDSPERALVHEIAHAWASGGPSALTEGRADLLADCIVTAVPALAPLDPDTGTSLDDMPDLRRWSARQRDGVIDLDTSREDAYLGSARLMRSVAQVVDRRALWPTSGLLRWRDFNDLLDNAGAPGTMILAILQGGEKTQREALSDVDRDGQPWIAEILGGTDPIRWDSDGDGWWDGAPATPSIAAVPLPPDGTPVCSGFSGRPGSLVQVLASGVWRGGGAPEIEAYEGERALSGDPTTGVRLSGDGPLLMRLRSDSPVAGGLWAMVGGTGLKVDTACRSTPRYTVWWAGGGSHAMFPEFLAALDIYVARAEKLLGPGSSRLVVRVGTDSFDVDRDGAVYLSEGEVAWAASTGRPDALAAVAVAVHRVFSSAHVDRPAEGAEALTRAMLDDPPDLTFVSIDLQKAEQRAKSVVDCPRGWEGVIDGRCVRPPLVAAEPDPPPKRRSWFRKSR